MGGAPDLRSFIYSSAGLDLDYDRTLLWTSSGTLAFTAYPVAAASSERHFRIYAWDGNNITNLSQNPDDHNGSPTWRSDGYWAFTTYFSEHQNLYIRDANNRTVLVTKGQYPPAWSREGRLLFCIPIREPGASWALAMWDGAGVVEILQCYDIQARWSNGNGVFCSSG